MNKFLLFVLILLVIFTVDCNQPSDAMQIKDWKQMTGKGALLTTRFQSFEQFKKVVQIEYSKKENDWVQLTHSSNGQTVISKLEAGVSESDFLRTRDGSFFDKIKLAFKSPYFVMSRNDLMRVYILSRRRHKVFGGGDVAFYDLAKTMMHNISDRDTASLDVEDVSEKGYINTFNHITAQALMTTIFSEKLADFVADTHERKNMPELISGKFTEEQLKDIKNGPVDNYIDIINNEWGQELGKLLAAKYNITRSTTWTPELLADYLNELQGYFSWVFEIGFKPFNPTDEMIVRFSGKINMTMGGVKRVR